MKRSTWVFSGMLVFGGLLLLFAAGLGLHSKSMMGMMTPGRGMMSMSGMMWMMRLWGVFVLAVLFAGLVGIFLVCYRLIDAGSSRCPNCHNPVRKGWEFCPHCGSNLSRRSSPRD